MSMSAWLRTGSERSAQQQQAFARPLPPDRVPDPVLLTVLSCPFYGVTPNIRAERRGTMPRFSGGQARQAAEDDAKDRLIGGARWQVDLDPLFQFDDTGGDLDEAQSQSVELHNASGRGFGHQPAHRP